MKVGYRIPAKKLPRNEYGGKWIRVCHANNRMSLVQWNMFHDLSPDQTMA